MKRILLKFLFLLNFIFLPFFVQETFACSCNSIPTPYKAYKESTAVFVGKVVGITDESGKEIIDDKSSDIMETWRSRYGETHYYRFEIQERFKGAEVSEITVSVGINMCQYGLVKGETLLVYAHGGDGLKGNLTTHLFCSRTGELETAQDDVHFLRALLKNKPEPRIYGSIQRYDFDGIAGTARYTYLEGIKIIAKNEKRQFETITDKNGLYSFDKLPNGKYKVYPQLPDKYTLDWGIDLEEINLVSAKDDYYPNYEYRTFTGSNAYSEFRVDWNNQISGKVLDAEGKPLERATVRLIPENQVNEKPLAEDRNNADELARESRDSNVRRYTIARRTPGKYILAVEVFAPFTSRDGRLRIYYPQAAGVEKAEIITLEEFDKRNIDIKLPDGFVVRDIEGSLVLADGTPIENGYVTLEKLENSKDKNNVVYDSQRVEKGKFKFQVFENAEYWIHAEVNQVEVKPIKIKIGKTNTPIEIKISLLK